MPNNNIPPIRFIIPRQPNTGRLLRIRHDESSKSEGGSNLAMARSVVGKEVVYCSNIKTPEGASWSIMGRNASARGCSRNNRWVCMCWAGKLQKTNGLGWVK